MAETSETAVQESIKTVSWEEFNPTEAERFLPGWERSDLLPNKNNPDVKWGWVFARVVNGLEWRLEINKRLRMVGISVGGIEIVPRVQHVEAIRFDPHEDTLWFLSDASKKEGYTVTSEGMFHHISSPDRTVDVSIDVERSKLK